MGERYAESVILDLERTWEESDPRTPLICLLSMGSDPTDSIIALGKRQKVETRYVSMGQGQEVHARKLLQQFMANVRHICPHHIQSHWSAKQIQFTVTLFHFSQNMGTDYNSAVFNVVFPIHTNRAAGLCSRTVTWAWTS